MERKVVTIFGGSGFLGRHLVRHLAQEGAIIRIAVRDPERAHPLRPAGNVGQIVPWYADITKPETIAAAVEGADSVVNLVGILYERGRRTFQRMHVDGAQAIAEASAAAGVAELVHVSAIGADLDSAAVYAQTKAAGENAVKAAFPKATILRPSVVFGPEDDFFNRFAAMSRFSPFLPVVGAGIRPQVIEPSTPEGKKKLTLIGDEGPKFQPVYVGDVAEAIVTSIKASEAKGKTYELGGPTVYSFKQLMELINAATGRNRWLLPIPYFIAEMQAAVLGLLPVPPLTLDQVALLRVDNVVPKGAKTLKTLGIRATSAETITPTYLTRYRSNAWQGVQGV